MLEEKNNFGGVTIEITYEENDKNSVILEASRLYYDQNNNLVKSISKITPQKSEETGIGFQEQQYENGRISYYKMYTTETEKRKRGYDYLIEFLELDDSVEICGYGFGDVFVKERTKTFSYNYPFYSLSYLFEQIYEEPYVPNPTGDEITYSVQYNEGRSLVTFISDPTPITNKDKLIIKYYFDTNGLTGSEIYKYKITALENDKQYTVFIQDGLLPYCVNNTKSLISFAVIGFNHTIYPLITSVIDVE